MALYLEIHVAGCPAERHELVGKRITLGTRENATIRLGNVKDFAPEVIEVHPGEQNVRVEIPPGTEGSLTFEGTSHRQVCVPFGGEVFVGSGRLTFLRVEERQRSPVVLLGAAVALLLFGVQAYQASIPEDPVGHEVPAPGLFDGQSAEICPESDAVVAITRAHDDERAAHAKLERSVFVTEDGVQAVVLFRQAAACYEVAQNKEDQARIRAELQYRTERLNEQYSTLRLRLRFALDKEHFRGALETARDLDALLSNQSNSAYRRWLKELERSLERRVFQSAQLG